MLNFIGGPIITGIIDGYKAKLASVNTTDAQAVDLAKQEIAAEIEARKQATIVILAEQGHWWTSLPRAAVQYAYAVFIVKVVVWDTVLGWGSTPPLHGDIATWSGMIMAFWFGGRTVEKVAQIFKR